MGTSMARWTCKKCLVSRCANIERKEYFNLIYRFMPISVKEAIGIVTEIEREYKILKL